jgi:hypothetical protein
MNEPLPGYQFENRGARGGVIRSAIIYTPLFVIALAVLITIVLQVVDGDGSIVLLIIFALVCLVLGFQSISALRDISAEFVETMGPVRRKWSRSDFVFWRSYYVDVEKKYFSVDRVPYELLQPDDVVVVKHLPHSERVESISRVRPAPAPTIDAAPSQVPNP